MNQQKLEEYDIEIVESSTNEDVEIVEAGTIIVEEEITQSTQATEEETFKPVEYSEWQSPVDFENYVMATARTAPPIFEGSRNSLRRTFAYYEKLSDEIADGVQQDASFADLNENQLRTLDSIEEGIDQALKDISAAITGKQRIKKVAGKSSSFHTYINPFIFGLARVLINGKVSQGKNIESLYDTLNKKYALDDREQLELSFALSDMGYPIRSSFVDFTDRMEQYQT